MNTTPINPACVVPPWLGGTCPPRPPKPAPIPIAPDPIKTLPIEARND